MAVRYLTGDTHPDHDTICTFRRENLEAVSEAFLQVLQLARQMGVLKVGTVSVKAKRTSLKTRRFLCGIDDAYLFRTLAGGDPG